jgi:hypothetical protein
MNKYLIMLLTTCFFSSVNHTAVLQKIRVEYVNRDIETPYNVSCSNFERFFGKNYYKVKTIYNKTELKQISACIDKVNDNAINVKEIDVRAKIILFYSNGKKSTVCVDRFDNAVVDQKKIIGTSGFYSFVERNCDGF